MTNPASVCLVADTVETHHAQTVDNRTLEFTEHRYLNAVTTALNATGHDVVHLESPKALVDQADRVADHVVVSFWSGEDNRSRRTLVPSTCESIGLSYAGADAYSAIVCQDKGLSKSYSRRYGVLSPRGVVFEPGDRIKQPGHLDGPLVVKPLLEGGSIGIDQNALCKTWSDVDDQVSRLHDKLDCPVIVEEFLEGEEISICLLGANGRDAKFAAVRLDVAGYDLAKGIWSMEIKKQLGNSPVNVPITNDLDEDLVENCRRLFDSFEKMDYMRIDGRMTKDGFRLIELTPDVHLGPNASFALSMGSLGVCYEAMWDELVGLAV